MMHQDSAGVRTFLHACISGNANARRQFQETYGETIYNFPVKIYGAPLEDAGDYYLYVFDQDRIFLRLKTFAGRENIQFRTFLSFYVLKHLFLDWRRTRKEINMISLHTPLQNSSDDSDTLEDLLPDTITSESANSDQLLVGRVADLLNALSPEDRVLLKLLSLLENNLSSEEVQFLASNSQRTVRDTLVLLTEIHDKLKRKDEKIASLCDELDAVWGWIVLRQKELHQVNQQLHFFSTVASIVDTEKLSIRKQELEDQLAQRLRQRARLVEELRSYKLTTPYKDIARLLNSTTCAVSSHIFRVREQLVRKLSDKSLKAIHPWRQKDNRKGHTPTADGADA